MPGAGKSTIVNKLEELGFEKFSLGDGIRAEAKRRSIEPSGENLGKIMLEVREKNGPGAVAELIKEPIQNSIEEVIIIDGVRSIAEIDVLKKIGDVKLLAIQASSETRFNFLSSRGRSDDPKTRENFEERDNREIGVGIDKSIENAEDDRSQGWEDLKNYNVNSGDFVIGITASGTTPYVVEALKKCGENNISTGCITSNPNSPVANHSNFPIEINVGPEFLTGSSRMKS